jgi:hypothetical protein
MIWSEGPVRPPAMIATCTITNAMCTAMGKSFEISEKAEAVQRSRCDFAWPKSTAILFVLQVRTFPCLNSIEVTAGHGQRRGHVRNDNPA